MGSFGKRRWKIFIRRSSSSKLEKPEPPRDYICPISGSLMFDPVVVSSGQTFERSSVEVCRELGFSPTLPDGSRPDFSAAIPNLNLKSTIHRWCDKSGVERPKAPDCSSVESSVRLKMPPPPPPSGGSTIRTSEVELLKGLAETPLVLFTHASTELNRHTNHFYSSSSEESVIANVPATPMLPFSTRPMCYSSASSEIASGEFSDPANNCSPEEEEYLAKLKSPDVFEQEQCLISLRNITRTKEEVRVTLCTPRLLFALRPLLISRYATVQPNAAAVLVNLSLEKENKVKIVRSGAVPPLIDLLKGGYAESQDHAAGALFSLALEDDNKTAIGVLGALPPLLHTLRSESRRARYDSALALYHLTMVQSNRVKLVKLGAVSTLLTMVSGELGGSVVLVMCNLAACPEGKSALLDSNAVEILVGMLRKESELVSESTRENCVAALYLLSHGSLRFKGLAKEARAGEVLREVAEKGSERVREKAKRIILAMRGGPDMAAAAATAEVDWEEVLEGGVSRTRYRFGKNPPSANSTEF